MNHSTFSPFGNGSTLAPLNWQPMPKTRGTWTIISTCLITLSLCLCSALHLNIPQHNGKTSQQRRKLGWLLVGLLAPEMVVYTALEQRRAAVRLTKEMQAVFGETPVSRWRKLMCLIMRRECPQGSGGPAVEMGEARSQGRRYPWTHVHSFYTIMGGFAFDTNKAVPNFLPNGRSRLTISIGGLKYIAKHSPSLIPDLSEDEIRDKSKADGLAKSLVCLQAGWFCSQCVVRLAQQQVISFLELNTFGHAICALLIYALWWYKPLDIDSPNLLMGRTAWETCALMCVTSTGEDVWSNLISRLLFRRIFSIHHVNGQETELSRGQKYGDRTITTWTDLFNGRHIARLRQHRFEPRAVFHWDPVPDRKDNLGSRTDETWAVSQDSAPQPQILSGESLKIRKGASLFGFRCTYVYTQADWYRTWPEPTGRNGLHTLHMYCNEIIYRQRTIEKDDQNREGLDRSGRECTFGPSDLYRWELVCRAWPTYQPKLQDSDGNERPRIYNGVCDRMRNWPTALHSGHSNHDLGVQLLIFAIAGGLYGGLHLLAWDAPFASYWERLIWRVSGVLIACSGPILLGYRYTLLFDALLFHVTEKLIESEQKPSRLRSLLDTIWTSVSVIITIAVYSGIILYVPARGFLLAECYVQLTRLPPAAYEVPNWSQYFPHIG